MKKLLIGTVITIFMNSVYAQNWAEWTQQSKTQRNYLLQQIAALQVYIGYAKEGYTIATKGLNTIQKIKRGDFDLHDEFFTSLKRVNPSIASSAKVPAIITRHIQIINETKKTVDGATKTGVFTSEELAHFKAVFQSLLLSCVEVMDELIGVTTDGEYGMKDDERIKRIDALHTDIQNKYAFMLAYSTEMGLLSMQRVNERIETGYSKKLRVGL